jgi:hypothetical protein
MRKSKQPGTKPTADDKPPGGGRAWQRARQFALERGLPLPANPSADDSKAAATAKHTPKRIVSKSTKQGATKNRGGVS